MLGVWVAGTRGLLIPCPAAELLLGGRVVLSVGVPKFKPLIVDLPHVLVLGVKSALLGLNLCVRGVSFAPEFMLLLEVIGQESFVPCNPGLLGAVLAVRGPVVVGRELLFGIPCRELRFEERRDRCWTNAAAASGNIAWIVEKSRCRESRWAGELGD